jgi:hypothetical protein
MSEENNDERSFGREAELEKHGFKPVEIKPPEAEPISKGEAVEAIKARHEPDSEPLKVSWHGDPKAAFSVESATEVVKLARAGDSERLEAPAREADQELADKIDTLRGEPTESEKREMARGVAATVAANEREHQALMEQVAADFQAQQHNHRAQQINSEEHVAHARGVAAITALTSEFPEIAGLQPHQIQTAVATMQSKNPQRAQALVARLRGIDAAVGQLKQVQAAKAQHANTHFTDWSKQQDQTFRARYASDPQYRAIGENMRNTLADYGIDVNRYVELASKPEGAFLRDAGVQSLLFDLSRMKLAAKSKPDVQAALKAQLARPDIPPVQRPGVAPLPRAAPSVANQQQLAARLKGAKGDAALKIATQMLQNRRKG